MSLARVNTALLAAIILVNLYVIGAPFLPALLFQVKNHQGERQRLTSLIHQPAAKPGQDERHANELIVPDMLLRAPVLEGPASKQYQLLNQGVWRYDHGSTSDKGGNTVLIGHRFTYTQPKGVFYYLNKLAMGDEIGFWWNNKQYLYRVTDIRQVPPTATEIQATSKDTRLTLYTCTPLWLPKDRLVVIATPEKS